MFEFTLSLSLSIMITDRARCDPTNNVYLDLQNRRYFTYIFVISFIGGVNRST
jgi:hypothetical protein